MNNDYHQHNYHGYQSQKILQLDHIQLQDYYMNLSPHPLIANRQYCNESNQFDKVNNISRNTNDNPS